MTHMLQYSPDEWLVPDLLGAAADSRSRCSSA